MPDEDFAFKSNPAQTSLPAMKPLLLSLVFGVTALGQSGPLGYYRFPAVHDDTVVFTAEGDLWRVPLRGGLARRLTTHPGMESHAAISPDGKTVAFAATYEGPREVYSMPIDGGLPTRHTFDAGDAIVVGWTPSGEILYATQSFSTLPNPQLAAVHPQTQQRRRLPLAQASDGAYLPDGQSLLFTRLPFQGSSTKRYRGGTVQNLWRFDADAPEAVPLTSDFPGTSKQPMWWQDRVYFLSDRDGVINLWSIQPNGDDPQQHTHHREFDIKWASHSQGVVVYAQGADLRQIDLATGRDRQVPIRLASDFDQTREQWVKAPMDYLTAAHLSPNGDRLVLTARGEVFVAPVKQGRFVQVTRKPGVRYRQARFLPDSDHLIALSDETGELEFWRLPANGVGTRELLTGDGRVFRFDGVPSPDGQWLAFHDKNQELWLSGIEPRTAPRRIAASPIDAFSDLAWSPDSAWLAYTEAATNTFRRIWLYRVADQTRFALTSDRVESYSPAWSPDGRWIYFLSDRQLRSVVSSPWGPRQPEPFFDEVTKIYQVALQAGLRSPFRAKDELREEPPTEPEASKADPDETKQAGKGKPVVRIDLEQLAARVEAVPVAAGNYRDLAVTRKHLYWLERPSGFDARTRLRRLELTADAPKAETVAEDLRSYELAANGEKLLLRRGDRFHVVPSDGGAPAKLEDTAVDLGGWTFALNPREEWRQIFVESWRLMRDYFYDRNLHGLDWPAVLQKYLPLVDRVSDRAELSDLIADMVGELSALHIFVRYGDQRAGPDDIQPGSLGARFERDPAGRGWRIAHVYETDPDYPEARSPLARPGVDVHEGDVIVAINGAPALSVSHPNQRLRQLAGKQVLLEVIPAGSAASRQVIVEPISPGAETELRYDEWEYTRRQRVERAGDGRLGYVHLRAMGAANIAEWARDFYPVFDRQGLIIDVRHNRGGNIDSWILGRLLRPAWFFWQPRVGNPIWNMQYAFRGHVVVLCNERTASDGEAFSEGFRRLGLGQLIGTRTWGGEIWLSFDNWLVDKGIASAAETGVYGPEGEWLIEGHGVEPDIVVDNLPHATFEGEDAQLEAAITHLLERIAEDPRTVPPSPPYPNKAFRP